MDNWRAFCGILGTLWELRSWHRLQHPIRAANLWRPFCQSSLQHARLVRLSCCVAPIGLDLGFAARSFLVMLPCLLCSPGVSSKSRISFFLQEQLSKPGMSTEPLGVAGSAQQLLRLQASRHLKCNVAATLKRDVTRSHLRAFTSEQESCYWWRGGKEQD